VLSIHPNDYPSLALNLGIFCETEGVFIAKVKLAITGSLLEGLLIYNELACMLFKLPKKESLNGVGNRHTLRVELLAEQLEVVLFLLGKEGKDHAQAVLASQEAACRRRGCC
jgi:hypothetical protein